MENKRIVVKVGTSTLTHDGGEINFRSFDRLARVLSEIHNMGYEVVLVSSGAIAVGCNKLRMTEKPQEIRMKQAAAAVGQCELMHIYDKFFGEYGQIVAQILLTGEDIDQPEKKSNLIGTFEALLEMGIIPIVNENDSVTHMEIESEHRIFGDNDTLSAIVTVMCSAGLLVLMSDIDGLYEEDPREVPDARMVREVRVLDDTIRALAHGAGTARGTGGMVTKLNAAKIVMDNGADMIIVNGASPEVLYDIVEGRPAGTLFVGHQQPKKAGEASGER